MPAVLFRLTSIPVLDTNGNVVSGAEAFFYETGTLDLAPIYQDADLIDEHTNPVVANSAGVLPNIYLDSDITYRLRVQSPAGILIDEADPYGDLSANEILTKLLTVDGTGSGLDADKVRGVGASRALVKKSVGASADYTAGAVVAWDAETYDTSAFHDNVTNNSRLTVPAGVGSFARVSAQISLSAVNVNEWIVAQLLKNGAAFDGHGRQSAFNDALVTPALNLSTPVIPVVAGDYFEVQLTNESDTSITVVSASSWFAIEMVP